MKTNTIAITALIDAPASALNMGDGSLDNFKNSVAVKVIRAKERLAYPYVAAQSSRSHLRRAVSEQPEFVMGQSERAETVAYSAGDPVKFWDDDLFGYMRAEAKETPAPRRGRAAQAAQAEPEDDTDDGQDGADAAKKKGESLTRTSPLRTGTSVSMVPVVTTKDFGVSARAEGDPVIHRHDFYRTVLMLPMSLNLREIGRFWSIKRSGEYHMKREKLEAYAADGKVSRAPDGAYELPVAERAQRAAALVRALPLVDGGAKMTTHFTDTRPRVLIMAVLPGSPLPFQYVLTFDGDVLSVNEGSLRQALQVYGPRLQLPLYVGWVEGFHDAARVRFREICEASGVQAVFDHPEIVAEQLAQQLVAHPELM